MRLLNGVLSAGLVLNVFHIQPVSSLVLLSHARMTESKYAFVRDSHQVCELELPSTKLPISVVVIDDDHLQLRLVEKHFNQKSVSQQFKRVLTFSDPAEAMAQMPVDGVTVILCDHDMPDGSGVDWLPDLIKQDVGPVILLTATGDEHVAAAAFRSGVSDYLLKQEVMPEPARLRRAIADAIRRFNLQRRNRQASRDLKLANINLEDRNVRLHEMTETAHQFVDNVAHEFRTPLTVIQEFASILRDGIGGQVTPEQSEYLGYIEAGVRDLSGLVDDFLDTSKLKARTLRVDRCEVAVADVFERVRPTAQARAHTKSITIDFEAEPGLPTVFCDIEKAGRVILNLIVNAVKFSPEGSTVQVRARANGNGDIQISIRDHGIGIAEEELPGLCERFQQTGDPNRDSGKGFGLGLNIARNLVWLNLGKISITSQLGEGSTFSFTLPIADPEHVLNCYLKRIDESEVLSQISVLRIEAVHPDASAEALRSALAGSCQSMDLLLCSKDGRSLIAIGPTEEPDRWMQRLSESWSMTGPIETSKAPLQMEWLGSWSIQKVRDYALPIVMRSLMEQRRCA